MRSSLQPDEPKHDVISVRYYVAFEKRLIFYLFFFTYLPIALLSIDLLIIIFTNFSFLLLFLLCQIEFEGLAGQFVYREYDIGIFLGLHALFVRDYLQQWGDSFAYLASSTADSNSSYASSSKTKTGHRKNTGLSHGKMSSNKIQAQHDETDLIKAYFFMVQRVTTNSF